MKLFLSFMLFIIVVCDSFLLKLKFYYDASFFVINQGSIKQIEKTLKKLNKAINDIFEDLEIEICFENYIQDVLKEKFLASPQYLDSVGFFGFLVSDPNIHANILLSSFNTNERYSNVCIIYQKFQD